MTTTELLEPRLIEALQPIRMHALAAAIFHLFDTGLYDALDARGPASPSPLAAHLDCDADRLHALLRYLRNEGLLDATADGFALTAKSRSLAPFRGYYALLVGGYAETLVQLGAALRRGAPPATRDGARVAAGSCAISEYDAIPLTRSLMRHVPGRCTRLLDLGCGDGGYLVAFCRAEEELRALGVEPDEGAFSAARARVQSAGLGDRVQLHRATAQEFLRGGSDFEPDFTVIGFVLQELLGQEGEDAVVDYLRRLVDRYPALHLLVIEVMDRVDDPVVSRHGLGLAYYNPYCLLHPFTRQRLEPAAFWERTFARAGLALVARETVDERVDSTGLTVGFVLRRAS